MTERAAIYVRVSTDIQRDNYSPGTQLEACRKYAEKQGYALVGDRYVDPVTAHDAPKGNGAIAAYVDDYTSRELSRPALDAAIGYAETVGYDVLIVHAIDRLARDPYIRQTLEREFSALGIAVRYVLGDYDDTPEGEVRKDMESTFAKWENAKRTERSKRGKLGKAERGLFVAGKPPYGYLIDKGAVGGLAVEETQAAIVRRIFAMYTQQGASLHTICKQLTAEGVPTWRGGTLWQKSSLLKILENTTYVGTSFYNKWDVSGKKRVLRPFEQWVPFEVTPLVDRDAFAKAQIQLEDNKQMSRKQPKREYLLSGMVVCEQCGMAYQAQATPPNHGNGLTTDGLCYRHRTSAGHCLNRQIASRRLEPAVWEEVRELLLHPASLLKGYENSLEQQQAANNRKRAQLDTLGRAGDKLRQKLSNLLSAFTDPDMRMTKAEYLEQKQRLDTELQAVENQRTAIHAELAQIPGDEELETLEAYAEDIRELLEGDEELTYEEKREILGILHVKTVIPVEGRARIEGWFGRALVIEGVSFMPGSWFERKAAYQPGNLQFTILLPNWQKA